MKSNLLTRRMPLVDYQTAWQAMRDFTDNRTADTPDELWLLEHPPVFTLGQAGKPEHVLAAGDIPVIHCDRGGQVTYHAPGQTVAYLLIDIKRLKLSSRELVSTIENTIVTLLASLGLAAHSDPAAPGVYVEQRKIASLGLRIRRGASYHGLALNRNMDLAPWQRINPCGHIGQAVTSLAAEGITLSRDGLESQLSALIADQLGLDVKAGDAPGWYNGATAQSHLPQGSHA
jgi:lipoyl(octanoyl) transferase